MSSGTKIASQAERRPFGRSWWRELLVGFVCVFAGLAISGRVLGAWYTRAHAALGNALVSGLELQSGVRLSFSATAEQLALDAWQATLVVQPPNAPTPTLVPFDLRVLGFLPTITFIALAVALPLASRQKNVRVLLVGLPLLELLLVGLMAAPMLSFLGGTGPVQAFALSPLTHTLLQVVYRALVVPPGMAFAIPLALVALLAHRVGGLSFRFPKG